MTTELWVCHLAKYVMKQIKTNVKLFSSCATFKPKIKNIDIFSRLSLPCCQFSLLNFIVCELCLRPIES